MSSLVIARRATEDCGPTWQSQTSGIAIGTIARMAIVLPMVVASNEAKEATATGRRSDPRDDRHEAI
jgi:hypothetical protein